MTKFRATFIIIPVIILVLLVAVFVFLRFEEPFCGDGICEEDELTDPVCDIDCAEECVTGASDGGKLGKFPGEEEPPSQEDIPEACSVGWNGTYIKLINSGEIEGKFLEETNIIDFSNAEIKSLAIELRRETAKDTAKAIAKWTFENIDYREEDKYVDCINSKASEVLQRRTGVCSTMTKLNIALLRANGIPAYSKTGCFQFNEACKLKQTFFPEQLPRFINITIDETGFAATYGSLHNWVTIFLIEDEGIEEVLLESTSGRLFESGCVNYRLYYPDPNDARACGLNQFDPNVKNCQEWNS